VVKAQFISEQDVVGPALEAAKAKHDLRKLSAEQMAEIEAYLDRQRDRCARVNVSAIVRHLTDKGIK
jgi:hypothetical protein